MKPVDPMVLLARVRALLRRAGRGGLASERRADLQLGALRISETSREVWLHGRPVTLTTQEFELLSLLARRAGELVSRDEVFRTVRGIDYDGLDRSIDGRVSKLRRKLGDDAAARRASRRCGARAICSFLTPGKPALEGMARSRRARLFIRSYVVLAGGLAGGRHAARPGFRRAAGAPGARADPWLVATLRLMEKDLAATPADVARSVPPSSAGNSARARSARSRRYVRRHAGDLPSELVDDAGKSTTSGARRRSAARSGWVLSSRPPKGCSCACCLSFSMHPSC
jgi:hypothetical protein